VPQRVPFGLKLSLFKALLVIEILLQRGIQVKEPAEYVGTGLSVV